MKPDDAPRPEYSFLLHCDECGQEVGFDEKLSRRHVGYPCPECGESMLTRRDFRNGKWLIRLVSLLERLDLARPRSAKLADNEVDFRIHTRGGRVSVTELDRG